MLGVFDMMTLYTILYCHDSQWHLPITYRLYYIIRPVNLYANCKGAPQSGIKVCFYQLSFKMTPKEQPVVTPGETGNKSTDVKICTSVLNYTILMNISWKPRPLALRLTCSGRIAAKCRVNGDYFENIIGKKMDARRKRPAVMRWPDITGCRLKFGDL